MPRRFYCACMFACIYVDKSRTGDHPPGVFKPPRRDALGTWKGGGGRGARRAPTGHRPDADHRPPTANNRIPTLGHAQASALPARDTQGAPAARRSTAARRAPPGAGQPAPPVPPGRGRALSPPPRPHTPSRTGPAPPDLPRPLSPNHRGVGGAPCPRPRSRAPFPPTTTTEGRGQGAGAPTGSLAPSGRGGVERAGEPGRRHTSRREAWGVGAGAGQGPEARRGAGRRPATARRAQSGGTTDDDRPRQTGPGPAAREATGRGERPRDGEAAARRAAQPARRDRRTRAARGPRAGERRSWPAPRAVGWGGGARGGPPPRHPRRTLGPTSRDVAGRAGRGEGHTPEAATPPPPPGARRGGGATPRPRTRLPSPLPFPIPRRTGVAAAEGEAREPGGAALGTRPPRVNDPSAGSPTETLLRLLLPLDSQVRPSSQRSARAVGRPRRGRSEGLTKPSNR